MNTDLKVGDTVAFKAAILFGLQEYVKAQLAENPDPTFHVATIEWGREAFSQEEADNILISFIEPPKPAEVDSSPTNSDVRKYQWPVFIQGIIPDSFDKPTLPAYELSAEIKRILFSLVERNSGQAVSNILNLGPNAQKGRGDRNNVYELQIGSETVRGPGDHSRYTFFWLPIAFSIVEDLKSPRTVIQNPL